MKKIFLFLTLLLCILTKINATVVYVDSANVAGFQDGTSWATAFSSFQAGINATNAGDSVWVAKGTYLPVSGNSFTLVGAIKIFGGFLNSYTSFAQRDFGNNVTVLGAVSVTSDQTTPTVFDGFTIKDSMSLTGTGATPNAAFTINNCIYTEIHGPALLIHYATVSVSNSMITKDTVTTDDYYLRNDVFIGGSAVSFNNCTFANNYNHIGSTMAVLKYSSNPYNPSAITVTNSTFNNNSTIIGCINIVGASTASIHNCAFSSNYQPYTLATETVPGGIYITDTSTHADIRNCSFTNNNFNNVVIDNRSVHTKIVKCTFSNDSCSGMISNSVKLSNYPNDSCVVDSCYFSGNTGMIVSAGISKPNISANSTVPVIIIKNNMFSTNIGTALSTWNGNGIGNGVNVSIYNDTFTLNTTGWNDLVSGTAISISGDLTHIANCIFSNNSATENGGAIYNASGDPYIENCTFSNNSATQKGGAIYDASISTISNCTFTDNTAIQGGGAFCHYNTSSYVNGACQIINSTFTNNSTAQVGGGAIYSYRAESADINSSTFSNNTAAQGNGGAIYSYKTGLLNVSQCSFSNDSAMNGIGGAIAHYADPSMSVGSPEATNCTFKNNVAMRGGGIANTSISLSTYCATCNRPVIINCLFTQNKATTYGGGVYDSTINLCKIVNSTFVNDTAATSGGAIYNASYSVLSLSNSIVYNNSTGVVNDATSIPNVFYSLIQGYPVSASNHNIAGTTDPLFVNPASSNYALQATSPCINLGNNDSIPAGITTDLAGYARISGGTVDLGAYEYLAPPLVSLGNDTDICSGTTLILNAGNTGSAYLWSTNDTTQAITINAAGTYYVTVTNGSGSATDTIHVTLLPAPVINLGNDTTICTGNSLTLNAGNAGDTYLWSTGATTQTISVNTTDNYSVTVTNASGCSAVDTVQVTAVASPAVNLGNDVTVTGNTYTLDAGNPGCAYLWSTGATTRTITVSTTGTYSVVATNANGCSDRDTIRVTFTPTGINDISMENGITVSPNPTKNHIILDIKSPALLKTQAYITDVNGKVLKRFMIQQKTQTISLSGFADGTYFLRLESGKTFKIVKE